MPAAAKFLPLVCAAAVLFAPAGASSQTPTAAEEALAKRQAKANDLGPARRSTIEKLLFKIEDDLLVERLLNPPRGFHLRLGGIAEGSGLGAGPGFRYHTAPFDFRTSAAGSIKRYFIAEAAVRFPGTFLDSLYVTRNGPYAELLVRRRDFPQEDFFGLGPDSDVEARSNFALRDTLTRATGGYRRGKFIAGVHAGYLDQRTGAGTDSRMASTTDLFPLATVPGLGVNLPLSFVQPFIELTTIDRALNETAGGLYRFSWSRYVDRERGQFDFSRWDLDLRQYVPLVHGTRTIALRARAASSDPEDGQQVPFFMQPTIGGASTLRGYRTYRFRDRSAMLLQAEYRWRINELISGALFYDTGAVARELSDLGRLEKDYGFGLRAGSRTGNVFRMDLAFGGSEGMRFLFRFDDVF